MTGMDTAFFNSATWFRYYSGLMPYEYLLPSQIAIIGVMAKICADFSRRAGFFFEKNRFFATAWLWFGYVYLAAMIARAVFLWARNLRIALESARTPSPALAVASWDW